MFRAQRHTAHKVNGHSARGWLTGWAGWLGWMWLRILLRCFVTAAAVVGCRRSADGQLAAVWSLAGSFVVRRSSDSPCSHHPAAAAAAAGGQQKTRTHARTHPLFITGLRASLNINIT